jgi:hypothetical protein
VGGVLVQALLWLGSAGLLGAGVAWLIHPRLPEDVRADFKDHAGLVSGVAGTIFAFTVGLMVVSASTTLSSAAGNVRAESRALLDVDWYAQTLPNPARSKIHALIGQYTQAVLAKDWPLMEREGVVSDDAWNLLNDLRVEMMTGITPPPGTGPAQYSQAMARLQDAFNARRTREDDAKANVPALLWYGLSVTGLLVMAIPIAIGGAGRIVHTTIGALTAVVIAFALLLISLLNGPFQGVMSVKPTPFQYVRDSLPKIATRF